MQNQKKSLAPLEEAKVNALDISIQLAVPSANKSTTATNSSPLLIPAAAIMTKQEEQETTILLKIDQSAQEIKRQKTAAIISVWCENYYDAALKCIQSAFVEEKFQEEQLTRLKIFLGPEKYWLYFQVKQKLYQLAWKKIKLQGQYDLWHTIGEILGEIQTKNGTQLTATQTATCFATLATELEAWRQQNQSTTERNELQNQAEILLIDGYDSLTVQNKFFNPLAQYYQQHILCLQHAALTTSTVLTMLRTDGAIVKAIQNIRVIINGHKLELEAINNEMAAQKNLVSAEAINMLLTTYRQSAIQFIEQDIKKTPENKITCYYGYTPKAMVDEIILISEPTTYNYLEIKQAHCVDHDGNTLLHHALKKYQELKTVAQKEAFLPIIETLYRHGAIAHTKNFLGKNAYEHAQIGSREWQILAGWKLGLLEIEATFVYSEMEENVKHILCEYSRNSQRCLTNGFFAWIISLFQDWHNLKATDRSRDVNEVLKEALYEALLQLDDDVLEQSIEQQRIKTSRGDKSKLFNKLMDEVITPLRQSKLFALKVKMSDALEFYKTKLIVTEQKLNALEAKGDELAHYSHSLEEKIAKMQVGFSQQINMEMQRVRQQLGLPLQNLASDTEDDSDESETASIGDGSGSITNSPSPNFLTCDKSPISLATCATSFFKASPTNEAVFASSTSATDAAPAFSHSFEYFENLQDTETETETESVKTTAKDAVAPTEVTITIATKDLKSTNPFDFSS